MRIRRRWTEEQKKSFSAICMGRKISPETRIKLSIAHTGLKVSLETRAKESIASKGRGHSPENRAKISATLRGHTVSPETREKLSKALKGRVQPEACRLALEAIHKASYGEGNPRWSGGRRMAIARYYTRRKGLGFIPLNSWFAGAEGHHINKFDVIYIPRKLHRSIYHRQRDGRGMAEMNILAGKYLTEDWT